MRPQADQNIPLDLVSLMRARGHDVAWVHEDMPGAADVSVLDQAQRQDRIVLTFDKDFGELAMRNRLPAASGIILLRITAPTASELALLVADILENRNDWHGHFSVISRNHVRMVPLPPTFTPASE